MEVYQWLSIIGIPGLIVAVWTKVLERSLKKRDQKQEEIRLETERKQEEIRKQNEKIEAQNAAVMAGVQALLRDRLVKDYRYYIDKGYADYEDRKNLENIWRQYHALGQNGAMDDLRAAFRALPVYRGGKEVDGGDLDD